MFMSLNVRLSRIMCGEVCALKPAECTLSHAAFSKLLP